MKRIIRYSIIAAILLSMIFVLPLHSQTSDDEDVNPSTQVARSGLERIPNEDPEVEGILSRIKENQKKMKKISAEITTENEYEPTSEMKAHGAKATKKTFRFAYDMDFETMNVHLSTKDGIPMDITFDGTDLYIKTKDGQVVKQERSEQTKAMLTKMLGEGFNKHDLKDIDKQFELKRNKGKDKWFSKLKAVEFIPRRSNQSAGKSGVMLARRMAWIDPDSGVTMESETYDDTGKVIMKQKVKKVEKINGVDMATDSETESENVNGRSKGRIKMEKIEIR